MPHHNVFHFADAANGLRTLAEDRADVNAGSRLPAMLLSLIMCACLACGTPADRNVVCPSIEVSAVAELQSDSNRQVALNDGRKLPLTKTPLVTTSDITGATASLTEGQWVLNVDVTDRAAKRIQAFSEQHVGRMLAFLVDGQVHSTPRILDPITGKGFLIGRFDEANAERLASAINKGCER